MSVQTKEARCYQHQSLLILKTRNGFSNGAFISNATAEERERQPFNCLRCGLIKLRVGEIIPIYCVEGRVEVVFVCTSCAKKGEHHD